MRPPRVDVHVEEVVLSGLGAVDRVEFSESFREELGRALAEDELAGTFGSDRRIASIRAGSLQRDSRGSAASLGAETARSVLRGLHSQGTSMGAPSGFGDGPVTQQ